MGYSAIHNQWGFGRACAPVFLSSLPPPNGALRAPPPRKSQLRCLFFDPQKYRKSIQLGPPMSRTFFFPLDRRGYEVLSALRPTHRSFADPSGNILGSKLYTGAAIRTNFFSVYLFFSFWISSFCYSLLFLLSFSISSYSSLLLSSQSSHWAILRLLILLLLYFKLFVVLQTCI